MRFNTLLITLIAICLFSCEKETDDGILEPVKESIDRFEIDVNTNISDNIPSYFEKDKVVLILPTQYKSKVKSKKTRLIIYCHSGGNSVFDNKSEAEESFFCKYFVSQGYAVLSVAGMPESYSKRLKIDHYRTVGSPVSLRAAEVAYDYVISKYNIYDDGCFIFCNSNGGLQAGNIVNLSNIPIIAQSGLAPLISTEKNAWLIPNASLSGGEFSEYQIRANIIRIFEISDISNIAELRKCKYDRAKIGIYDPYDYIINQTNKAYKVPYLIFAMKDDVSIYFDIIQNFMNVLNMRGSDIVIGDTEEFGAHNVSMNPVYVGNFSYMSKKNKLNLTVKKVMDFFIFHEIESNKKTKNG